MFPPSLEKYSQKKNTFFDVKEIFGVLSEEVFSFQILLLSFLLLAVNSADIIFHSALKFEYDTTVTFLLIYTSVLCMFLVIPKKLEITKRFWFFLFVLFCYLSLQMINGYVVTKTVYMPALSLICIVSVIYFWKILDGICFKKVVALMTNIYFLTFLFYIFCDIGSLIFLSKSQHVLLSNVLPFQLLIMMCLTILFSEKPILLKVIRLFFVLFVLYTVSSALIFTEDKRLQMKVIILIPSIFLLYFFMVKLKPFFVNKFNKRFYLVWLPMFTLMLCLAGIPITLYFGFKYYDLAEVLNRGTSGTLRIMINSERLNEVFASWATTLSGYGLGSSSKANLILFAERFHVLKSHSGIVSLIYEHGFLGFAIILTVLIYFFYSNLSSNQCLKLSEPHLSKIFYAFALLFVTFLLWILLNIVYLIAVPTSNYVDQTQIYSLVLIVFVLRKIINNPTSIFSVR